ncbi:MULTISPECIES: FAD-binding oxidoreductase [unclassified Ruegeria]|uniref:NAD(P)/FAD-dependent oxidoreductase n=1 Tax=unclassified Ruegeria TaxID=2625375 RepID=UPI001490E033|nr:MULTISPECIES: FAD-dependent oxidoreductase [unclassified Ruegeria]NOD89694.1 FAD-dependent oxidoreductase [Ruegeria sp. HKCCD4318]NOE14017.1 FAD-dependent oxidoreductase [Ruegeria sp. HKCCD4318-2]NOG08046.1 FAD-binding oxidoreductase [Ruegeria sp. HKCCD4315]
MSQPDAIIIGTGVIGAAIAFEMSKAGWKTLSLDRNTQVGHGSTAGSCAIIRMHYSTFDGTAFAWEGYHYWRDWADYLDLPEDANLAQFRETGCLVMKTDANGMLEKHMRNSSDLDCPFEEWSAEKVVERLPVYSLDSFAPARRMDDPEFGQSNGRKMTGGVYWPQAGYVTDPALSAQNLMDAAKQHGAEVRTGAEVTEILTEGGRVSGVKLASGEEIHAKVVVNVAGPGSAIINEMAGVLNDMTIKTRPLRQEVVHVPAPEGFDFENDGTIVSDSDIACYCRPEHGNHILVGSEDPECDPHQWCEDDVNYNHEFTDQWTTQAMRYAQRVPSLGIPSKTRGVVDLYDASTDWIPIYDKSSLPGFYMACGSSGNQYKNAPIAGKMMTALISYCEGGADHDAEPLQFELPYIKRNIDVGFYSRKRPINEESSFSVLG